MMKSLKIIALLLCATIVTYGQNEVIKNNPFWNNDSIVLFINGNITSLPILELRPDTFDYRVNLAVYRDYNENCSYVKGLEKVKMENYFFYNNRIILFSFTKNYITKLNKDDLGRYLKKNTIIQVNASNCILKVVSKAKIKKKEIESLYYLGKITLFNILLETEEVYDFYRLIINEG